MTIGKQLVIVSTSFATIILIASWFCLYYYLGVWPPDIVSERVAVLAAAKSDSGERFEIVQFFNGYESYTTQLKQFSQDGAIHTVVIDGDAFKSWTCSVAVDESEKKLTISLPGGSESLEYRWDEKRFVSPSRR
jgi:hypothetical protein